MNNYNLTKKNQKLLIYPIGDVHVGSPQFNQTYFEYMLSKFKKAPRTKIIYLLGDLLDCATKRLGNSAYHTTMTLDEQADYILKQLKPYKKYIRYSTIGNHEERAVKEHDFDIMKLISTQLNIPYNANEFTDTIKINDNEINIWGAHGTKTSQQLHLMMGHVQRQTEHINSDIYLYGHAHYGHCWSNISNGKRRHYCLTGHYLNYEGSYAENKLLKPSYPCYTTIQIDGNGLINTNTYHSDQEN